jgi:hypothetical protein
MVLLQILFWVFRSQVLRFCRPLCAVEVEAKKRAGLIFWLSVAENQQRSIRSALGRQEVAVRVLQISLATLLIKPIVTRLY